MSKIRVAVLRGGPGHEYPVSLQTGENVLKHLPERYHAVDILIDRNGVWHYRGAPIRPLDLNRYADVAFNAMHGEYGEDGQVQRVLEQARLPYTGSGTFASALGMNKELAKKAFRRAGLRVPAGKLVDKTGADENKTEARSEGLANVVDGAAREVFRAVPPPWIVKPADRGSSVGLFLCRNFDDLKRAIAECFKFSDKVLVEEYIRGREATVGVVERFRGKTNYALPPIEIRRPGNQDIWTYADKYNGQTAEICPGAFSSEEKTGLEKLAVLAHQALGLRHYSRSDFILSPRGIYLLETNSLPGLTGESLLPKALAAVGCDYPDFLHHLVQLALARQ